MTSSQSQGFDHEEVGALDFYSIKSRTFSLKRYNFIPMEGIHKGLKRTTGGTVPLSLVVVLREP